MRPEPGIVAGTAPRNTWRTLKRIHWLHGIQELTGYANSHIFFVVFVWFPSKRDWSKTAAEEGRAGIASFHA